ncbi:hypothetical protein Ade02nite_82410 [Paractinoplanes deccanensis]|uniref:Uncharacterized protein n=1 Tax=Paractinoplanes deccanensis TaxID=113561 RepID=A0ABQ3YI47_9ACTN|nr:hypothetical protein Ade02nite_82410 [Actinoplanes deccanensis]
MHDDLRGLGAGLVDRGALGLVFTHDYSLVIRTVAHIGASPTPGYRLPGTG